MKSDTGIKYRLNQVRQFLEYPDTKMSPALFCYIFLVLRRPDLFIERPPAQISFQRFQWPRFRGIAVHAWEIRKVEEFLAGFEPDEPWDYPDRSTVARSLRNREYMRNASMRLEWDMQELERTLDEKDRLALSTKEERAQYRKRAEDDREQMSTGFRDLDRFRRLLKREPALRARDVQRRLHVKKEVARWLIDNELKAGHVRMVHYHSGSPLIVRA